MEPAIKTSRSHNALHRDMRQADPSGMMLDSPGAGAGAPYMGPLDSQFANYPLHLDLYNPSPSSTKRDRLPQFEPRAATIAMGSGKDSASRLYNLQRQDRSSTASLAEFLKSTGPADLRGSASDEMPRPASPTKKKTGGGFLLKFAVGKNAGSPKKDDGNEPPSPTRSVASSTIAQTNYTAAGRKYYAIKVDYPVPDDASMSRRPLLAESSMDDRDETQSEVDYHTVMARKKHHRVSSVLASEASMDYLEDKTPRTSGYSYSSRNAHSIARSSSFSEMRSSASFRDDSSLLPTDSISLRPAQVSRTKVSATPNVIQARSVPNDYDRCGQTNGNIRSSAESYATASVVESGSEQAPSPVPPSVVSTGTMELIQSLNMLDQLRKQKATDEESMISYATTRSIQQRRRAKKAAVAAGGGSVDETKRFAKHTIKHSRSTADLNTKGLPPLPPHMTQAPDDYRRARAAAVAAALSPRYTSRETSPVPSLPPPKAPTRQNSLEGYAIPEDDVLSLHSTTSVTRNLRREKVKAKRQQDIDAERERRLDEAMRLLQEDVQRKREALERQERKLAAAAVGSQTPRQTRSVDRLRTSPPYYTQFSLSPISTLIDSAPSGPREHTSGKKFPNPDDLDIGPKSSNSQHTVFTNGPITPESSTPSSPTKDEYRDLVNQPIPQFKSLPPNYPPPQPTAEQVSSKTTKPRKMGESQDQKEESRIQALEEQKWVLEQALRVLLNHQTGNGTVAANPLLSTLMGSTSPPPN
jgi:hypothetical protein